MATIRRNIEYLNKTFGDYRSELINYSQTYFPNTYTDFSETSPGMMFIEQAAYIGDVLSFYLDNQIQENFLQYARQTSNLYDLSYMYGYKPKVTGLASVDLSFYQLIPSIISASGADNIYIPDYNYALRIGETTSASTGTPAVSEYSSGRWTLNFWPIVPIGKPFLLKEPSKGT